MQYIIIYDFFLQSIKCTPRFLEILLNYQNLKEPVTITRECATFFLLFNAGILFLFNEYFFVVAKAISL